MKPIKTDQNPLLAFVEFERRVMSADALDGFGFTIVNELRAILPYRQAIYWNENKGIVAVSGVVDVARQSPFALYISELFKTINRGLEKREPSILRPQELPRKLAEQWDEWISGQAYALPLSSGIVLVSRQQPFGPAEETVLQRLQLPLTVTERALGRRLFPKSADRKRRRARVLVIVVVLLLAMLIPIRDSILASSEMVAKNPSVVRSPMEGVVEQVFVRPNEIVSKGQPLFSLDLTTLIGKLEVAQQEQRTAEAQYREMAQAQIFDPKAKVQVALLKAKVSEKAATVIYLENLISRGRVTAPREGIAVFDDPTDWIGRPVVVGEKVMQVAAPTDTEIEAWVALGDIGTVQVGAPLTLFLNTNPLHPLQATVETVAYEASGRPDGTVMYRVRAKLRAGSQPARIGLKGVARVDGGRIALGWWLLRKPVTFFRQRTGL